MTAHAVDAAGSLYLIDTSVWIFALSRRRQETVRRRVDSLLQSDSVATCGLVELELLGGVGREEEFTRLRRRLQGVRRLDTLEVDWQRGAEIASALRRQGLTVPPTDALLAAIALRVGVVLLHADRDFDVIAQHQPLQVESLVEQVATT
jgi:predicted nucleic acid-binding protein